ncbi:hypothetical protein DPMN_168154 [Dreissena polymorpha]|uniref:Chitin-binding type-2 domain-containing protein n=1 Tax=Dreissena polymorpha TaxID=45954 RepID=A0A9D4F5W5_DREPO|nr:hypothetical protein DPMN_168154 [Dreissena polymorpha]
MKTGKTYTDGQTCNGFFRCSEGRSLPSSCSQGHSYNVLSGGCLPDFSCMQASLDKHRTYSCMHYAVSSIRRF